ncbi:hypothetical protein ACG2LH_18105 [Zhouia sp. PK063]|uniref:hypothetical protein n=1 Tax=Zhouia sp. PK063 TaxID=3373602 RepID=UPI0037930C5A
MSKTQFLFRLLPLMVVLFHSTNSIQAQSSKYPYFMDRFWKKESDKKQNIFLTNQLVNNTSEGKRYVEQLNRYHKEFYDLMNEKKAREREYYTYDNQYQQYLKQYKAANAMLILAKTNLSMCRTNCESVRQNANNIINNMNNLAVKINSANDEANRTNDRLNWISKRLFAIDDLQHDMSIELGAYLKEKIASGIVKVNN